TTVDGPGGIQRRRRLKFDTAPGAEPTFVTANLTQFSFDANSHEFVFDPPEVQQNQELSLFVVAPGGAILDKEMTIRGDGDRQEWSVDINAFDLALQLISLGIVQRDMMPVASDHERELIDDPQERADFIQKVIGRTQFLLETEFRTMPDGGIV